jgi:hypothetical protein
MGVTLGLSNKRFQNCHIGLDYCPKSPAHIDYRLGDLSYCQTSWATWYLNGEEEKELEFYSMRIICENN